MSSASATEGKKWIQTFVALTCIIMGYVLIGFFEKMAEWFPLEAKVPYYFGVTQFLSVLIGLVTFIVIMKNPKSSIYLQDVFAELTKVVWPDKQQTWKHTIVIMISVTIMGFVFGFFDFGANYLFSLIHK